MNGAGAKVASLPSAVRQARNVRCTCWRDKSPMVYRWQDHQPRKYRKAEKLLEQIRGFRKLLRQGQLSKTISFPVRHQLPSRNWLKITFKTAKTSTPTENLNSNKPWWEAGKIREKTCLGMLCPPLPGGGGCPPFLGSSSGALTPQPGLCAQLSVPGSNVFPFLPSLPSVSFSDSCPAHLGLPSRCSHISWGLCGQAVPASPPG